MNSNLNDALTSDRSAGRAYVIASFLAWGLLPLFWRSIREVPPAEILAHRVIWSGLFFAALAQHRGKLPEITRAFQIPALRWRIALTAILLACNWATYVVAVNTGHVLEASLGYYISPIFNILLGVVFLNERLSRRGWVAVCLASIGVLSIVIQGQGIPYFALGITSSFCLYALVRKGVKLDPTAASTAESIVLAPVALGFLLFSATSQPLHWIPQSTFVLLCLTGVVTGLPLLWFTEGTRRLPLSYAGFFQFITPTAQFGLATLVYGEVVTPAYAKAFFLIWAAVALYCTELVYRGGSRRVVAVDLEEAGAAVQS